MRHRLHVMASLSMWALFGYYWKVVLSREIGSGNFRAIAILGLLVVIGLAVTTVWIRHNLRLARKFEGRRQGVRHASAPDLDRDTIGRPVDHPDLAALRAAAVIDIDADEARKTYRIAATEEAP